MGFALSWLAVRGKPAATVLSELSLRSSGERSLTGEAPFVGAASAAGSYLIVADETGSALLAPSVVEPLSRGCEVVTCTVEEHVMFSEATGWRDGRRVWKGTHVGEDGPVGLGATGELPPQFVSIRAELEAAQRADGSADAEADHQFDIPVRVAGALTGYRHDEESPAIEPADDEGLEVLESHSRRRRARVIGSRHCVTANADAEWLGACASWRQLRVGPHMGWSPMRRRHDWHRKAGC